MSALITAAVVVGGAAIYGAVAKGQAAKKAANLRISAIDKMKELDIPGIQTASQEADKARFKGSLELQKELDPAAAEARKSGLEAVASSVKGPEDERAATALEQALKGYEISEADAQLVRAKLLSDAQKQLELGASLPPEFQAELVRSGLEKTSSAGLTPDKQGAAGQTLRKLIGGAGIQLQEQRRQSAVSSLQTVEASKASNASILQNLAQGFQSLLNSKAQRATNAATVGQQLLPAFGITGGDVANLNVANTNLFNNKLLAKGDAQAQKALASGQMNAEIAGGVASMVGGVGTGAAGSAATNGSGILGAGRSNGWW